MTDTDLSTLSTRFAHALSGGDLGANIALGVYQLALDTYEAQVGACADAIEASEHEDPRADPVCVAAWEAIDRMAPQTARCAYHDAVRGLTLSDAHRKAYTDSNAREFRIHNWARDLWYEMGSDDERAEARAEAAYEMRVCP